MTLKPQCSWCKKRAGFEESKQLRMVVSCFKKLCEYIMSSPIGSDLQEQAKNGETESLVRLIKEGVDFDIFSKFLHTQHDNAWRR
jgi:male-specific lethal 2